MYVVINGTGRYIPYREALEHDNVTIPVDELFIKHDNDDWNGGGGDGHFIKFSETDYYRRNPELQSGENVNYLYGTFQKENNISSSHHLHGDYDRDKLDFYCFGHIYPVFNVFVNSFTTIC